MGSELCGNGLEMEGTVTSYFESSCVDPTVEKKDVRRFSRSSAVTFDHRPNSIECVIPDSNRENAEQIVDSPCHDLVMLLSSPPSVSCFDSIDNGSQTPKECIFDPFAHVHDKFMLTPRHKKGMEESRNTVVRRLNLSSDINSVRSTNQEAYDDNFSEDEEEQLFNIVYSTLLDAIIKDQAGEFFSNSLPQFSDSDEFCTPISAARLSGIADTCPGAPKKSTSKCRNIDRKLCKKLEY